MSKREYVRHELADIEDQLADKNPDAVGEDMTDLAAIGLARYSPTTTPSQITELVAEARRHGRSWDQIGNRLGMSGDEARKVYGDGSSGLLTAVATSGVGAAVLIAIRHLFRNLGRVSRT
jgi:hypothetical protein